MEILTVTKENLSIYLNLAQCYEAEFSRLTGKKPDEQGLFELDTQLSENIKGLLLIVEGTPAAIAAISVKEQKHYEVCEFYVVPSFRKNSLGMRFAHLIWKMYPGEWEIKQIAGAEYASEFWRKTITTFGLKSYEENSYEDPYWGVVTRQRFSVKQ